MQACLKNCVRRYSGESGEDGIAHFRAGDAVATFAPDVAGAEAGFEDGVHGAFDGLGVLLEMEAVTQEHGRGEDLSDGVGEIFASNVRGGAAGGFVEAKAARGQRGAGEHAQRAGDGCKFVANNVAKEVFAEQNIEVGRAADDLHGGVVHVEEVEGDVGVICRDVADGAAPELRSFQDVGFIYEGEFFAAGACGLKGDVGDAFNLVGVINHGVHGTFATMLGGASAFGLAKVETAGEFAHDEDVETEGGDVGAQWAGVGKFGVEASRAEVGEELEVFADGEQGGALGLLVGGQGFPLGAADGAEENGGGLLAEFFCGFGEGVAVVINSDAADVGFFEDETQVVSGVECVEDFQGFTHDFGADAVAGKDRDKVICSHAVC